MSGREPISKKLRFDVFKRDGFVCQYCGAHPPAVTLEVDHMHPVVRGGVTLIDNLITACFDCNRGKGAGQLTSIPQTIEQKAEMLADREEQIKAYNRLLASKRRRENATIAAIERVFADAFPTWSFNDRFREGIRRKFLPHLDTDQLVRGISIACEKLHDPERAIKYFCGICWNTIKQQANGE